MRSAVPSLVLVTHSSAGCAADVSSVTVRCDFSEFFVSHLAIPAPTMRELSRDVSVDL